MTTALLLLILCVLLLGAATAGNFIVGFAGIIIATGIFIFGLDSMPPAVWVGLGAIVIMLEVQLILLFREKKEPHKAQIAKEKVSG